MTARVWRIWLIVVALLAGPLAAHAFIEQADQDPIAAKAELALWWGDIEALEALYAAAQGVTTENPWNGRSPLASVRSGMASVMKYGQLDGAYFRELEQLTARWVQLKPGSALRHLLHARVLYGRAWHVRGDGYWNTVPEPARAEFVRLVAHAQRVLTEHAELLVPDTTTHIYLLMIGRSASWPPEQVRAIAEDGLARGSADALAILEEWVFTLLPKWQGDLVQVAKVIDTYTPRVDPARRDELYAQLWSNVASGIDGNLFRQSTADWPRMRNGLTALAGRRQHPFFRNRLAYLACLAQDRETTRTALAAIPEPDLDAWAGGGARGRQNHEACVAWLASAR